MEKISLRALIPDEAWKPVGVDFVGETALRLARIEGKYKWHEHEVEEEFFLVVSGVLFVDTETDIVELREWEGCKVPPGVQHRCRAPGGAVVLMIEPVTTKTCGEH
jgi:mannose-6-phosphate isomerase-like protein (cupin superfamily)